MSLENFSDTEYNALLRTMYLEYFKKIDDENTRLRKENDTLKSISSCSSYSRHDINCIDDFEPFTCSNCKKTYCGSIHNYVCMSYDCQCLDCCNGCCECFSGEGDTTQVCYYCVDEIECKCCLYKMNNTFL